MDTLDDSITYDVAIAGGGIAGCSAAILLARLGRRVILLEKGKIPNHKLCGEFLSTEASDMFRHLGVLCAVHEAGAVPITSTTVTTARGAVFRQCLPGTALGLSRYELDRILIEAAESEGAVCVQGASVKRVTGSLSHGFHVTADDTTYRARTVLGAHGKKSALDTQLGRSFTGGTDWVAYKQHYDGPGFPGVIELHVFDGGYCGMSPIEDGQVNVCWIQHEAVTKQCGGDIDEIRAKALRQNPRLAARLDSLRPIPGTVRAISRPPLVRKTHFDGDVCMIGDAAGMIAPLCGDGMSMAMHSAAIAAPLIGEFLDGRATPESFKRNYVAAWNAEFRPRLTLGRLIHDHAVNPTFGDHLVGACARHPSFARWLIAKTRG